MARLDWEKANQSERDRLHAKRALADKHEQNKAKQAGRRQAALKAWAAERSLSCFRCGRPGSDVQIAKTGVGARGAWLVCIDCVRKQAG